jgi:hypothetical protein
MCGLLRLEHELELLLKLTGTGLRQKLEDLVLYLNRLKEAAEKRAQESKRGSGREAGGFDDGESRHSLSTTVSMAVKRAMDFMKHDNDKESVTSSDVSVPIRGHTETKRASDISQQRSSAHVSSFSHHSASHLSPQIPAPGSGVSLISLHYFISLSQTSLSRNRTSISHPHFISPSLHFPVSLTGLDPKSSAAQEQYLSTSFSAHVHAQAAPLYNQYRDRLESEESSAIVQNPVVSIVAQAFVALLAII